MNALMPQPLVNLALARLDQGDPDAALALLDRVPAAQGGAAWHAALGVIHLAASRFDDALAALRIAVSLGDARPDILLNLALAEDRAGDSGRAWDLMRDLHRIYPNWEEPLLRLAEASRRAGRPVEAETHYATLLERNPGRPEALISLAVLKLQRRAPAEAQMLLLRCCSMAPDCAEAWDALGTALLQTGDLSAAESAFAEAGRLDPTNIDFAIHRATAAHAAGSGTDELARLEQAALADPLDIAGLTATGILLDLLGETRRAIDLLEAAVSLAPDAPAPASALAMSLVRANRATAALPALAHAASLSPDDLDLRNNHAAALVRLQRHREAAEELASLIADHGEQPGFLANLVNAQISLGLHDQALVTADRLTTLFPDMPLSWRSLCNALPYCDGTDAARMLAAGRRAAASLTATPEPLSEHRDPQRRLRIGLLSNALRTHPVGWFTAAGLENLDPAKFEIVCLGSQDTEHSDDSLQRRFRALSAAWHPATDAAQIRALGIDILIDLGGHGDGGMLNLCAERLAPVQMKWVGSQSHSTGLAAIDHFITDRWETPAGFEHFYSENLLRLQDGYVCYSPPPYAPDIGPLPASQRDGIVFGCFNNLAKITARVIATWAAILCAVPHARLVLKCHQLADPPTRERIAAAFADHSIASHRLDLRGSSSHRDLLAQYGDIDIALDPFPYTGGLTTCEALWMGVPVITLAGEIFAARHSTSHLSNIGLQDWVASDLDAYRDMAIARAADLPALGTLRATLRPRMKASPLCDAPRFGRSLGTALRQAWIAHCNTP